MWYKIWLKDPENMPETIFRLTTSPNGTPFVYCASSSKDGAIWIMLSCQTEPIASDYLNNMWEDGEIRLEPFSDYPAPLTQDQRNEFDEHVATAPRWPFDD